MMKKIEAEHFDRKDKHLDFLMKLLVATIIFFGTAITILLAIDLFMN